MTVRDQLRTVRDDRATLRERRGALGDRRGALMGRLGVSGGRLGGLGGLRRRMGGEQGSTLLLTIFYACLALLLVLVVTASSSLYLERKRLLSLADGAALAGAATFNMSELAAAASGGRALLNDAGVATQVHSFVEDAPHAFEDLAVDRAVSPDGTSVLVELSAVWRPPVVAPLLPEGIRLRVQASARSLLG